MKENKMLVPIAADEKGPGPGKYALPTTIGFLNHDSSRQKYPAYSFGQNLIDVNRKARSPGPIYFVDPRITYRGKDGTPKFSASERQRELNAFKTPPLTSYFPEKVHPQGEKVAPKHSISTRTQYRQKDPKPSPDKYSLPPVLGNKQVNKMSAPTFSFTGHQYIGSYAQDLAKTPGPCPYDPIDPDKKGYRAPQFSMRRKSHMPGDKTKKPGPGQYSPEKVSVSRVTAPRYSLGIRHSVSVCPYIGG